MAYILDPMYFPDPGGGIISDNVPWVQYLNPAAKGKWVGFADMVQALDQNIILELTSPVGTWTSLYYGLMAQLGNWEWNTRKFDESIEVSPLYKGFYEMVMSERQNIEIKIKKVVDDIIAHTSDLELLMHDLRRYKEFYDYFNFDRKGGGKPDEHSLKAVFVDMVDFHAGEGAPGRLSMSFMQQNNIFPTIIQDFFALTSEEDLEKNDRLRNIPTVEKEMLRTKWKAYLQWKEIFGKEVRSRYTRLKELADAKKAMIEKSKEWLKPFIARHEVLKEGIAADMGKRYIADPWHPAVQPTSSTSITVWAWKEFPAAEIHKMSGEEFVKELKKEYSFIEPYEERDGQTKVLKYRLEDEWTMKNLILDPDVGLKNKYPFITREWVQKKVNEIYAVDDWFRAKKRIRRNYLYYAFLEINFNVWTTRTATGLEIEDTNIGVRAYWMSRNILLTKLLELKAKQEKFENDLNRLLGIDPDIKYEEEEYEGKLRKAVSLAGKESFREAKERLLGSFGSLKNAFQRSIDSKEAMKGVVSEELAKAMVKVQEKEPKPISFAEPLKKIFRNFNDFFGFNIDPSQLFRNRPYEMNFKPRITKFYLTPLGKFYFGPAVKYLRAQIMR